MTLETVQDLNPVLEVTVGTFGLILIIAVHGVGVRRIIRVFSEHWVRVTAQTAPWKVNLLFTLVIAGLAALHLLETLFWAVPIRAYGLIPNLRDCYYFVLESYTTLGDSTVSLPVDWRLIGPIIAMSGLFTFGWTCSLMVSIMSDLGRLDRARAAQENHQIAQDMPPHE